MIYLLIISIVSMILIVYSYTLGIKHTLNIINKENINSELKLFKHTTNKISDKEDEEIEKLNIALENINNYEPRGLKQKDV